MKLRIGEKVFIILVLVLTLLFLLGCAANGFYRNRESMRRSECFEVAKQDIIAEYGFETVVWLDIEEVKLALNREDFYIFTCIADEEDSLREYRFAVTIREVDGDVDIDTWLIREGE